MPLSRKELAMLSRVASTGARGVGPVSGSGIDLPPAGTLHAGLGDVAISFTGAQVVAVADETRTAPMPDSGDVAARRSLAIKVASKYAAEVSASESMSLGRLRAILGAPDWKKRREPVGVRVQGVLVDGPLAARAVSAWPDNEEVTVETVAETSSLDNSRYGVLIVRGPRFFALTMGLNDDERPGETPESTARYEAATARRAATTAAKEAAETAARQEAIDADVAAARASGHYDRAASLLADAQAIAAQAENDVEAFRVGEKGPGDAERKLETAGRFLQDAGAVIQGSGARSDPELYRLTKYVHERLVKLQLQLADEKKTKRPPRPTSTPNALLGLRDVEAVSVSRSRSRGVTTTEFIVQTKSEPIRHVRVLVSGPSPSTRKHDALVRGLALLNGAAAVAPKPLYDPHSDPHLKPHERTQLAAERQSPKPKIATRYPEVEYRGYKIKDRGPGRDSASLHAVYSPDGRFLFTEHSLQDARHYVDREIDGSEPERAVDPLAEQYGEVGARKMRAKGERRRGLAERYGEAMAAKMSGADEPVDPEEGAAFDAELRELEK